MVPMMVTNGTNGTSKIHYYAIIVIYKRLNLYIQNAITVLVSTFFLFETDRLKPLT